MSKSSSEGVRYVVRPRSFRAFRRESEAIAFVKRIGRRVIGVRRAHGRVIVNYFERTRDAD